MERDDEPEAAMSEVDEVLRGEAGATAVVDVHTRAVDVGGEVDEDVGQAAGTDGVDALVVLRRAEHDVAVHERGTDDLGGAPSGSCGTRARPVPWSSQPAATPDTNSTAAGSLKM